MNPSENRLQLARIFLLLVGLTLAACGRLPLPDSSTATPTVTVTPTATPTSTPTPTPTPLPPLLVLLAPPDADPALADFLQTELAARAFENGFRWQVRPSMQAAEVAAGVAYLVAMPGSQGLAELVAAAPQTRFLAVDVPGLQPAPNLIALGGQGAAPDQIGFIAGYTAALITPNWRTGVISVEDTAAGVAGRQGFVNGVRFFCGLCRTPVPPFYEYPLFIGLNAGASDAEWRVAADYMIDHVVKTVYVEPGAGGEDLLRYLTQAGVHVIGGVQPPEAGLENWVLSIRPEIAQAYLDNWPSLLGGEPGFSQPLPILLADANPALLSPGKLAHIRAVFADVQNGFILPNPALP